MKFERANDVKKPSQPANVTLNIMKKIPVAVLGATGAVGQQFVVLLENHPWFEIAALMASERSAGKTYAEAVSWRQPTRLPSSAASLKVQPCEPGGDFQIAFSGLDA